MMFELARRRSRRRRYARDIREQTVSGSESASTRSNRLKDELELPSADHLLRFTAYFTIWVWWEGTESSPPNLLDIAKHGVTRRACQISTRHRLTEMAALRAELNSALLSWECVGGSPVRARAECEAVNADPDLIDAVSKHEKNQQQLLLFSWQDEERTRRREEMCTQMLDPLRATACWFLDNTGKPSETVEAARHFLELRELLLPEEPLDPDSVGKLVDELLNSAEVPVQRHLIHTLNKAFKGYERPDLAERLTSLAPL